MEMKNFAAVLFVLLVGCPGSGSSTSSFPGSVPDESYPSGHPLSVNEVEPTLAQLETDVFDLTNQKRAASGLAPLVRNQVLDAIARGHSTHMQIHNFYAHVNPEGDAPTDRMTKVVQNVPLLDWENCWMATDSVTAQEIVDAFWGSPDHQQAMLSPTSITGVGLHRYPSGYGFDMIWITVEFVQLVN